MMFSERGVAAELLAEDIGCLKREKDFSNYFFFFISDYTCIFFRTCSAFFCAAVQTLT